MNIFAIDKNYKLCSIVLDNKRVVKMILESAQLLCNGIRRINVIGSPELFDDAILNKLYKPTHMNHPCSFWAGDSPVNWVWLYYYFFHLCNIYDNYISKNMIYNISTSIQYHHKSFEKLNPVFEIVLKTFEDCFNNGLKFKEEYIYNNIVEHPNCTIYKDIGDVYLAYKMCLFNKWENLDKIPPKFSYYTITNFMDFNDDRLYFYNLLLNIMYNDNDIPETDKTHLRKLEFLKPIL